jgi:acetylornithine deacetylase/succinyl-diaminopimelate desuccinylase-like protein
VPTIPAVDAAAATRLIDQQFAQSIVPALTEYVKIPNKSPMFDPQWREHGHMDRAVALVERWMRENMPKGATLEVLRLEGRTPLIYCDVPGQIDGTVLLYGHLDKQPEMVGWDEGLGPWTPVLRGERLYGRGAADDGYAAFASLLALRVLAEQKIPHARCVLLIEACEESGSVDLPAYIEHLSTKIGDPTLVVCLDSGCGNYEQMWSTTSLRGVLTGTLRVQVLKEGVHSGDASGVVASSFRIARQLIDRLEDVASGEIRVKDFHVEIPAQRVAQAKAVADVLGDELSAKFPWVPGMKPMAEAPADLILNRTWRPFLALTGADDIPAIANGGNVLRPQTSLKLSLRLPPLIDAHAAIAKVKQLLETDPPYGAKVEFVDTEGGNGWNAPALAPWLEKSLEAASKTHFGRPCMYMGEGGSIPFMGMLGKKFPAAQFLITGVLGPSSNAHGPNEFLDLPTAKRLTACVAQVIRDHAAR